MFSFRSFIIALALCVLSSSLAVAHPAGTAVPDTKNAPKYSHRLIVELADPPLGQWSRATGLARSSGRLNAQHQAAKTQAARLETAQNAFLGRLQQQLPGARISSCRDESGSLKPLRYGVAFNGFAIDPGSAPQADARRIIEAIPGVKRVYLDRAHYPTMYASLPLIDADDAWLNPGIGGQADAGKGIKIASMDGGIHKDAPMFSGAGFSYPPGFEPAGLGLTANNNGKIIASRTYFRDWDPPKDGDGTAWPGQFGTSHGVHTSGTMAGNAVTADYMGAGIPLSGVAPAAWVMSYRVFYMSVNSDESFYDAEGIAALEDIVNDGADVVNNSWGGGPTSAGGEYDALDTALRNAWDAGIFVAMSAGNAGPDLGTADHPSLSYINVAATTSGGTYADGTVSVSGPEPVTGNVTNAPYAVAGFGPSLELGKEFTYPLKAAGTVDAANANGCSTWAAGAFDNATAIIARGTCAFSQKVYYAQQAGARAVIIYNNAGDSTMTMTCSSYCTSITIPSVFIGQTKGEAIKAWCDSHAADARVKLSTTAFQVGNTPDVVANFSSRGPGVGLTLKPDIAAPGVNILSQGYTPGATGEARHLGFGQASGTSMAAPHVAGAAALVQQAHPDWSPAWIKSALMTTSKYLDIYTEGGQPAQPLDMGAGRIDVLKALDPGVIIDPPSVSYGMVEATGTAVKTLTLRNVASSAETYTITTLCTAAGFPGTSPLAGVSVDPASVTLGPGETGTVQVNFNAAAGAGVGDNQGFVVFAGSAGHAAHVPLWARVKPANNNKVLLIDNDFSSRSASYPDYVSYYTAALDGLSVAYDIREVDLYSTAVTLPQAAELAAYDAIIYFSGDHYSGGPLTSHDMDILIEYANSGGLVIASGQDLSQVASNHLFFNFVLAGLVLADGVNGDGVLPDQLIAAADTAPQAFKTMTLDAKAGGDGAANQLYIDKISANPFGSHLLAPYLNTATPLFVYPGVSGNSTVAMLHRDQPCLERPGISYYGRSAYLAFGLEGLNNDTGATTRQALLGKLLDWGRDAPSVDFSVMGAETGACGFMASLTAPVAGVDAASYRWDYGDSSGYAGPYDTVAAGHTYSSSGSYTVRVEATNALGNRAVKSKSVTVTVVPTTSTTVAPTTTAPATTTIEAPSTTTTVETVTTTTTTVKSGPCPSAKALGEDNPKLENLRALRDGRLAQNALGRKLVGLYYGNSEMINAALDRSPVLRTLACKALETIAPMVGE